MVRISGLTFYRQDTEVLEEIKKEYPTATVSEIKQQLSQRWKSLSKSEKEKFLVKAREVKQESLCLQDDLDYDEIPKDIEPRIKSNKEVHTPFRVQYYDELNDNKLEKELINIENDIESLRQLLYSI